MSTLSEVGAEAPGGDMGVIGWRMRRRFSLSASPARSGSRRGALARMKGAFSALLAMVASAWAATLLLFAIAGAWLVVVDLVWGGPVSDALAPLGIG